MALDVNPHHRRLATPRPTVRTAANLLTFLINLFKLIGIGIRINERMIQAVLCVKLWFSEDTLVLKETSTIFASSDINHVDNYL